MKLAFYALVAIANLYYALDAITTQHLFMASVHVVAFIGAQILFGKALERWMN